MMKIPTVNLLQHKIHLRLHGTRLPTNYTIYVRLTKDHDTANQPKRPIRRRRKYDPKLAQRAPQSSSSDPEADTEKDTLPNTPNSKPTSTSHSDNEEEETTRLTNAYPGATNSVGSVHQRTWYLSMDRINSGFMPVKDKQTKKGIWIRKKGDGEKEEENEGYPFFVMGRDQERSIVTGRLAKDILMDEGVVSYVPRRLWRPVME
jgi:hypothetical protein